jgi:hypothetical protein
MVSRQGFEENGCHLETEENNGKSKIAVIAVRCEPGNY